MGDQLRFVDDSGDTRLAGELVDDGATVGDVLTVQSDGSLAAAAGGGSSSAEYRSFIPVVGGALGREPFTLPAATRNVPGTDRTVVAGTVTVFKQAGSSIHANVQAQTELASVTLQYCTLGVYRVDAGGSIDDWIWVDTDATTEIPGGDDDVTVTWDDGVQGGGAGVLTLNADNQTIDIAADGFYCISGDAVFVDPT